MADDAGIDIGQLSPDQQAALEQYTAVTAQDVKDAVPLLERSQWNVQVCIGPSPLRSHAREGPPARTSTDRDRRLPSPSSSMAKAPIP